LYIFSDNAREREQLLQGQTSGGAVINETMYHLAKLTRDSGIKVVVTGEGADELFLGYDLFKEVSVRRFCLRQPASLGRQRLLDRLYPELISQGGDGEFWRRFFLEAGAPSDPLFSHLPRFKLSARARDFYAPEFKSGLGEIDVLGDLIVAAARTSREAAASHSAAIINFPKTAR